MKNSNQKSDRPNRQILTGLILGWGLQGLFSLPALAQPSLPESPAAIENQAEPAPTAITEIAVDAPETILPENQQLVDRNIPASDPSLPESPATIENLGETVAEESAEQVTSVAQLSDVKPTDWAFGALQSLVERYGCIAGYPDGTFRGNRALTRYEFAAGVNACLDKIRELIGTGNENLIKREDLLTVQRLQEEFAADIAVLRGRTDLIEARTTELQANQFSPTVKLSGFTVVGIQGRSPNGADRAPRDGKRDTKDPGTNVNTINLNQLYFTAQFSPRSNLLIGLFNQNGSTSPQLTEDVNLAYNFGETSGATLSDLNYRFLVGDKLAVFAGTAGVNMISGLRGPNRAESAASGPISAFAQRNPILNTGFGLGGAGIDWQFAKRASLQAVYSTNIPGFFVSSNGPSGHNTLGLQLTLTPADPVDITVYYVNDYSPNGNLISFTGDSQLTAVNPSTSKSASLQTNAVGASLNWRVSSRVALGGWAGYTNSRIPGKSGSVATTNYMVFVNFPDLFGEGNLGGIYIGQPPKIVSSNLPTGNNIPDFLDTGLGRKGGQPGTTTHVEVFYRWQVSDNISVTPGVMVIFQPDHSRNSDPITVGVLRTSFSF
ncbi:MAG: carbohydrate porin [Microcoleus sp. PH2017_10_PVI_O_A]|uniref:iron uptake porin n=1 Tax=unclassified Microcoleus TaxID=2642155 RepID=UPI001DA5757D|nr:MULTISPECIES: iron uptake porin [unclassified Microcoleus]TAE76225.1 MAG: S-layer protein [Oscillatoriales cyanobacterium]MCC3408298.1 carbohydrate porin [Microcoleus sp. PH2017_10_PVI_O_A]MCC3461630.1 carbohydrate porin [Microcoleus sp. PH2017_11_PCY_U_A]MCC3480859.1 carbohydrate porin [Microcoleus sp. PH2017_12_PCY_D_A]MCC3530766.1 carbohydrate porin [Microcoleus sp. PH2017_21_RUC_O_A]